ncbi:MAG: hypothetical protein VW872_02430, partial [Candidatus Poseidoniales archaeon]
VFVRVHIILKVKFFVINVGGDDFVFSFNINVLFLVGLALVCVNFNNDFIIDLFLSLWRCFVIVFLVFS